VPRRAASDGLSPSRIPANLDPELRNFLEELVRHRRGSVILDNGRGGSQWRIRVADDGDLVAERWQTPSGSARSEWVEIATIGAAP